MRRNLPPTRQTQGVIKRCMAASSSSSTPSIKVPTANPLKSWESGAQMVKNPKINNEYLEHIRDIHDPSLHLKTIEDELKGTIGKALGKQAQKIVAALRQMNDEYSKYEALLEDEERGYDMRSPEVVEIAKKYNFYRKQAEQFRWELIVHRQAVGFTVGNHKYIMETFPIGEPLYEPPEEDEGNGGLDMDKKAKKEPKQFGDQLDW
eukprot:CAMPEP_0113636756 /NCGR_PEP_ID=MMETSP0017_2-20120614/19196_1 /TAXON_ID=2856 /ORGANISM="Cylindrotheca closterium" /LENGTH=205 /DNA_ID=CAMNT_0000547665 /DNA_START=43 /DNA_END=657 /DNA_ORIENTATION=- /assembly_acc=CAM_ASM_000147